MLCSESSGPKRPAADPYHLQKGRNQTRSQGKFDPDLFYLDLTMIALRWCSSDLETVLFDGDRVGSPGLIYCQLPGSPKLMAES